MAYTVVEFNSHVNSGDPVKLTSATDNITVVLHFGNTSVLLDANQSIRTIDGSKNIDPVTTTITNNNSIDLGARFSKFDIINSTDVKVAIADELVLAEVGTVAIV